MYLLAEGTPLTLLPILPLATFCITILITLGISCKNREKEEGLPHICHAGARAASNYVFAIGLTLTSILFISCIMSYHLYLTTLSLSHPIYILNIITLIIGWMVAVALVATGLINIQLHYVWHQRAASSLMISLVLYLILLTILSFLLPIPDRPSERILALRVLPSVLIFACACYACYLYCTQGDTIMSDSHEPLLDTIYVHGAPPRNRATFATIPSQSSHGRSHWLSQIPNDDTPHHNHNGIKSNGNALTPTPIIPSLIKDKQGSMIYYETVTKAIYPTSDVSDSEVEESEDETIQRISYHPHPRICSHRDQIAYTQYMSVLCVVMFWISFIFEFHHLKMTSSLWHIVRA